MTFEELKNDHRETFQRLQGLNRPDVGVHKKTKLKVLGQRSRSTLLDDSVRATHAARLLKQFLGRWGGLERDEALERLRLVTVLDSVVPLDVDQCLQAVTGMRARLKDACERVRGIEVIGAVEIEVVNLKKMRQLRSEADEARKLNVLESLVPSIGKPNLFDKRVNSFALVHFHGIVDFGVDSDEKEVVLREKMKRWWYKPYQIELKSFHSDKALKTNLENIAKYLVKGGNESLIYKIGFGYDEAEKLERQMLKAGKNTLRPDFEGFINEMSLTIEEICFLGGVIDRIMNSSGGKNWRNGYIFKYGQQHRY